MKKTKPKKIARVVIDDDKLIDEAVRLGGHRTKRKTVEEALQEFILRRKRDPDSRRLLAQRAKREP